jgi:hypothetical protein
MTAPKSYNNQQYKNLLCLYIETLYNSLPSNLRPSINTMRQNFCGTGSEEDSGSGQSGETLQYWLDSRVPLTIPQVKDVLGDPWFSWDMDNDCTILESISKDIFGNTTIPNPRIINPIVDTVGFDSEQTDLLKQLGGFIHYLFARTYYIDRCYGTTAYLNYYFGGSLENFYAAHTEDFATYVDSTGMIRGNILLSAWQDDSAFRGVIIVLNFIKPLAGLFCDDFWNWSNPNIYWWTESRLWSGSWVDDLIIQDSWYDGSGNTASVGDSKLITALGSPVFPGYRVSVNDIYSTITLTESDMLAQLFGNNLLKGPVQIDDLPESTYSEYCNIPPPPTPTPTPTPTQTPTPTPTPVTATPTPTPTQTPVTATPTPTQTSSQASPPPPPPSPSAA